nr:MAG TPA: repressor domain protein [Caudoviricetes sp.]
MESNTQIFDYKNFKVRTVQKDGEPWFVLKDVCCVLNLGTPARVAERLDGDEVSLTHLTDSIGRQQEITIINEPGLYNVVLRSDKPEAKPFRKWVTSDVLPSIRKHGLYATEDLLANPDLAIAAFTALKEEREKRKELEAVVEEQKPLVSFANKVSNTKDLINMGEMAKLLKDKHIDIGRNRLFAILREERILMKSNVPYQQYIDRGYFEVKEAVRENSYGNKVFPTTYVTGKGQLFLTKEIQKIFESEGE